MEKIQSSMPTYSGFVEHVKRVRCFLASPSGQRMPVLPATPPVLRRAPPSLGEHTDEVLAELGLNAAEVATLRSRGVI